MTKLAKFYNKIFDYSLQKGTHIKIIDMINYRRIVKQNNIIPLMTKHIYNEIPIRLAKRVTDLNNLPFGLSDNKSGFNSCKIRYSFICYGFPPECRQVYHI